MADPTTDKQIDELSKRVDFGFEQTNQRLGRVEDDVRELRAEMRAGFDQVNGRFDKINDRFAEVSGRRFDTVNDRFDKVNDEFTAVRLEMKAGFDGMQRLMTRFFAGTLGSIIAGVVVIVASHS